MESDEKPPQEQEQTPPPPPTVIPLTPAVYGNQSLNRGGPLPTGMALAFGALTVCWVPFLGFGLSVMSLIQAISYLKAPPKDSDNSAAAILAIVVGLGSAVIGLGSAVIGFGMLMGSCPHVYSFDGQRWRLDADPLSGSLFAGAERQDWDRLEHLQPVSGQYRVKVVDELQETDHIDELALLAVDHSVGTTVLPTPSGELLTFSGAVPPLTASDGKGRDVLAALVAQDDVFPKSNPRDFATSTAGNPRELLTLTFPRPASSAAVLQLRAHSSPFAEDSYVRYMATMGPGAGKLMRLAQQDKDYPYPQRVADEMRRLGLPLLVRTEGQGATIEVGPIGPAIQRDFALPLRLPPGDGPVQVQIEMTPLFWENDQVLLAANPTPATTVQRLLPLSAHDHKGRDVQRLLTTPDGQRVDLQSGEFVEAVFAAPPVSEGQQRTVIATIRGYYEMEFGGRAWLDPLALLLHRLGHRSLPRFAIDRAQSAAP